MHELHALYHALFLETGDPQLLAWMASCICAITSDRGVEAGYPHAPAFAFHNLFPYFVQPSKMQPDGMNFDDDASSPADLEMQCEAQPARLCLQQSLPIPGCLHIVHNATRHMLSAMPHFEDKVRPGFSALVDFLHKKFTRQRFVATCLEPLPEARVFIQLFNSFPHTVVKWRFGTLAAVCKDLAEVEVPLRRFWNSARLQFQQAARQNQEEAHAGAADGAFGDNRLEGPNTFKAGEAVLSNTFWSWVHMICSLASCIGHMEAWFESCPCHSAPQGRDRMRLFGKISCPLKNFRAPELACQEFRPFLDELAMLSAAEVAFKHTVFCNDADRAWILEDFEAGRQHLQFNLTMQTSCWTIRLLTLQLSGDVFFFLDDDDQEVVNEKFMLALRRCVQFSAAQNLPWEILYPGAKQQIIEEHKRLFDEMCPRPPAYICDLDQNVGFMSAGPVWPCLVRHGTIYSLNKERHATAPELFAAQGFPVHEKCQAPYSCGFQKFFEKGLTQTDSHKLLGNGHVRSHLGFNDPLCLVQCRTSFCSADPPNITDAQR